MRRFTALSRRAIRPRIASRREGGMAHWKRLQGATNFRDLGGWPGQDGGQGASVQPDDPGGGEPGGEQAPAFHLWRNGRRDRP